MEVALNLIRGFKKLMINDNNRESTFYKLFINLIKLDFKHIAP